MSIDVLTMHCVYDIDMSLRRMDENRKMISIRLPPDVLKALDTWRDEQEVPPQRTAVIIEALRRFLADARKSKR